jgi:SAM-dependent methyltransferase
MARTLSAERLPPAACAALTQAGASAIAIVPLVAGLEVTLGQWAVMQGAIALRIATLGGAARWWLPLHLVFVPALVAASALEIPSTVWGIAFIALCAVYGSTFRTQVPLFLTGKQVRGKLAELLAPERGLRIADLGCGLGGVITGLKRLRPECELYGVELAPLPYLVSAWRAWRCGCRVERRDLMDVDLSTFDIVYAFLSPAPMPALWRKAQREMRPGSLFVSLAFPVPDVKPDSVIAVSSRARHTLYVWRM